MQPTTHKKKEGIALVVVLGMLSVLLIFGVAFSVSMRTERMATRSFLDVVRSRQLVHTALYQVLGEHIPAEIEEKGLVYPEVETFSAAGPGEVTFIGSWSFDDDTPFVPRSLWTAVEPLGFAPGVPWLPLRDSATGDLLEPYAEYAFLVINNSGLLDANVIGAREEETTPRLRGFDTGEIRFHPGVLPEAQNPTLHTFRNALGRFETVPELYRLTSSSDLAAVGDLPSLQFPRFVDNLHVFSRYPQGFGELGPGNVWVANTNLAFIGGPPAQWDIPAIASAIDDLFPNADERDNFIRAMYDYADEGYVPFGSTDDQKFRRFSAKPVPMINEVIVSNDLQLVTGGAGQELILRIHLTVETWFPFPADPDNTSFRIEVDNPAITQFVPGFYGQFTGPVQLDNGPVPATFVPDPAQPQLTSFTFSKRQSVNSPGFPPYPLPVGGGGVFNVFFNMDQIRVMQGGNAVDMVFGPWPNDAFNLDGRQPALVLDGPTSGTGQDGDTIILAEAANDPRINWDPEDQLHWDTVGGGGMTPGAINTIRVTGEQGTHNYLLDEVGFMYARRGPIGSVGEVGFLLFDETRPWTTVRLLKGAPDPRDMSPMLDRLTVHTDPIRRGLVNVNTRQREALMAALYEMPVERYPDPNNLGPPLDINQTGQLADVFMASSDNVASYSGFVTNINPALVDAVVGSANDKFLRESVVRNSLGVLGVRHNLFTIYVAARMFSDRYDPTDNTQVAQKEDYIVADQRAVAVVWRDPFRTTDSVGNSTYKSWMNFFLWETGARDVE